MGFLNDEVFPAFWDSASKERIERFGTQFRFTQNLYDVSAPATQLLSNNIDEEGRALRSAAKVPKPLLAMAVQARDNPVGGLDLPSQCWLNSVGDSELMRGKCNRCVVQECSGRV